jgi:hypothetical protein
LLFSVVGLNDNHQVRYEKAVSQPKPLAIGSAQIEFLTWLSAREDLASFNGDVPYPIYIVAAQGGGAYAGLHAAVFLTSTQQLCPNFAHHLFAISGVSGGSVGAAVFSAIIREAEREGEIKLSDTGCNTTGESSRRALVEAATAVMSRDFWGPLQASLLFPDFLQRFMFWPVPQFDRAVALEKALEKAWVEMPRQVRFGEKDVPVDDFFAAPYVSHWQTFKHSPALLLNMTEIQSGNRRLIAPFEFRGTGGLQFFPLRDTGSTKVNYLPLNTAAVLSTRFPWITPYGRILEEQKSSVRQIVDGGYFENFGAATAMDLVSSLIPGSKHNYSYV